MKIALITDQHFGVRNSSVALLDNQQKFYENIFFPTIDDYKINTIVDLGDCFDNRKSINMYALHRAKEMYFDEILKRDITIHSIVGNHNSYFKNTNDINSNALLLREYDNIRIYDKTPVDVDIDGKKILMAPWLAPEKHDEWFSALGDSKADILMGHLEISGFEMHKGAICEKGVSKDVFEKFDLVFSGHFHQKSHYGNIHYLGAPYEMIWSDYNEDRGFHIFDTETYELTFVKNPYNLFHKIHYDGKNIQVEDLIDLDFSEIKNKYVKVIVRNKDNSYVYDMFIEALNKFGALDVKAVDDHMNMNTLADEELIDEAEDILTIFKNYVDGLPVQEGNKLVIKNVLYELYNEALTNAANVQ